jgi:thiamine kinase-like enzyme
MDNEIALDSISKELGLTKPSFTRLGTDNKNIVYCLQGSDKKYIVKKYVRKLNGGLDPLILEVMAHELFIESKIAIPPILKIDYDERIIVREFVEGRMPKDVKDLLKVVDYLKQIHAIPNRPKGLFYRSPGDISEGLELIAEYRKIPIPEVIKKTAKELEKLLKSQEEVIGYGDGNPDNFLITDHGVMGIDFDFLSTTTRYLDLGILLSHAKLPRSDKQSLGRRYFNCTDTPTLLALDAGIMQYNVMLIGIYLRELTENVQVDKIKRLLPAHQEAVSLNFSESTEIKEMGLWINHSCCVYFM